MFADTTSHFTYMRVTFHFLWLLGPLNIIGYDPKLEPARGRNRSGLRLPSTCATRYILYIPISNCAPSSPSKQSLGWWWNEIVGYIYIYTYTRCSKTFVNVQASKITKAIEKCAPLLKAWGSSNVHKFSNLYVNWRALGFAARRKKKSLKFGKQPWPR